MRRFLSLAALLWCAAIGSAQTEWAGAKWIWDQPEADSQAQTNEPRYVRRTFEVNGDVAKAELRITCDNEYVAYVNGKKIGGDANWNSVETFDVAKHLSRGKNLLAIEARNHGGVAGLIAALHVRTADKKDLYVVTDDKCKITQLQDANWLSADFKDAGWANASVLGDPGIGPWSLTGGPAVVAGKKTGGFDFPAVDPKVKDRQKPEDQTKNFILPEGFVAELVAGDPLVINPVTIATDDRGRVLVSESHTYRYGPSGSPVKPFRNPVVRLDPDGKGGFKRTLIADGFDDPVMGIAVKGDKLWLAANNFLFTYDYPDEGPASNKKLIVQDKNKAWNPFGMFVLEWGPDGLLYLSVGDHKIALEGPDGKMTGRANSGIVVRMKPDGTKMERMANGFRVPYSFEYDPFGQMWLLSNGEGNPNRFARIIDGVDYHCFSRGNVDNNWLAGNSPLAPPVNELHRGAHTQMMRYYGGAYPPAYDGSLLFCNWGGHGYPGLNRGIFRWVPDERNDIKHKEPFVLCSDPYFRPAHICLDPQGNLLIADWYGRDDESDMTGRIWRIKYVGKGNPTTDQPLFDKDSGLNSAIRALRSRSIRTRELAMAKILEDLKGGGHSPVHLVEVAMQEKEPLGAANALWALLRLGTKESQAAIAQGAKHPDWRIRRLAVNILRKHNLPGAADLAKVLSQDSDPAVRLEAAIARATPEEVRAAMLDALEQGAAKDQHLRYEAAFHLAKNGDEATYAKLLGSEDENLRLAGLIAVDIAGHEDFASRKAGLAALAKAIETPGKLDLVNALQVIHLVGDASVVPSLGKMLGRDDLPAAAMAKGLTLMKSKGGAFSKNLTGAAVKRFLDGVQKGSIPLTTTADQLLVLEFLETEGPTDFAVKHVSSQIASGHPTVKPTAHLVARKFGPKAQGISESLWNGVLQPKAKLDDAIDSITTLTKVEAKPDVSKWEKLLATEDANRRIDAVRAFRAFKGQPAMVKLLTDKADALVKADDSIRGDVEAVFHDLGVTASSVPMPEKDKAGLTQAALEGFKLSAAEKTNRAALGRAVFERSACVKCHTSATQTTPLAPSLKGIAAQKADYLIESILFPSKIIKTGFETEVLVTKAGQTHSGLVKEEGNGYRVLNLDKDILVPKSEVEERSKQKLSIMPEGQETQMSRREFVDLILYLSTLK
ncbi:MAG: HEAT repeat domain-containing protein [Gemmataceae bacterium]|nr:HEAT repeat domain-containing protein [Gemmataceae bacterium]